MATPFYARAATNATVCKGCNTEVSPKDQSFGKFVRAYGNMYHLQCFFCGSGGSETESCRQKLEKWNCQTLDGALYCPKCLEKIRKNKLLNENKVKSSRSITSVPVVPAYIPATASSTRFIPSPASELAPASNIPFSQLSAPQSSPPGKSSPRPVSLPVTRDEKAPDIQKILEALNGTHNQTYNQFNNGQFNKNDNVNNNTNVNNSTNNSNSNSKSTLGPLTERIMNASPRTDRFQFLGGSGTTPLCPACSKSVYKFEEVKLAKSSWHRQCFTCGGTSSEGCKRVINGPYELVSEVPFCKACHQKQVRETVAKTSTSKKITMVADLREEAEKISKRPPKLDLSDNKIHITISDMDEILNDLRANATLTAPDSPSSKAKLKKFHRQSINEPSCPLCHLPINKADEFSCFGMAWHKVCFCCGGSTAEGCKRVLNEGNFIEHNAIPFCKTCAYEKQAKFNPRVSPSRSPLSSPTSKATLTTEQVISALSTPKQDNIFSFKDIVIDSPRTKSKHSLMTPKDTDGNSFYSNGGSTPKPGPSSMTRSNSTASVVKISSPRSNVVLLSPPKPIIISAPQPPDSPAIIPSRSPPQKKISMKTVVDPDSSFDMIFPSNEATFFDYTKNDVLEEAENEHAILLSDLITFTDISIDDVIYRGFHFSYESDFDEKGVLFWIGSQGRTDFYRNPHTAGYIIASMSSVHVGDPFNIVARTIEHCPNYTANCERSWIEIDFGFRRLFLADSYSIRHGGSSQGNALRNWELQARVGKESEEEEEWLTLKTHVDDETLSDKPNSSATWEIEIPSDISEELTTLGFRYYRIVQTGPNSDGNNCLFCCGLEFYGILFERLTGKGIDEDGEESGKSNYSLGNGGLVSNRGSNGSLVSLADQKEESTSANISDNSSPKTQPLSSRSSLELTHSQRFKKN